MQQLPRVTVVFLVFNRREKLRLSLEKTLAENNYPADRLDVIVVDNGSEDGSAEMLAADFPTVKVIQRAENCGVSGWNDGFAQAEGDYVLALDDDCYLPPDGLLRAVEAAQERDADLVSFSVANDDAHRFNDDYDTGLLSFWGCAVLLRREVLETLGGYDPEIFVWANELEFMVRFFDHGFRHLHLPEIVAIHMKVPTPPHEWFAYGYKINHRNFGYIIGKLLRPRDAVAAFVAVFSITVRDAYRDDRAAAKALPGLVRGFARGLQMRRPVKNREVSRLYRENMHSFAGPWTFARRPRDLIIAIPARIAGAVGLASGNGNGNGEPHDVGRRREYFAARARFYPERAATLQLRPGARD